METIKIGTTDLKAEVFPEYGGVLYKLNYKGKDILHNIPEKLGKENVLAGGIPILFPFCGAVSDDKYELNGKVYDMPFHGFVKDMALKVKAKTETKVELILESNEVTQKYYPFDFEFVVRYEIINNSVKISAEIKNNSNEDMPFCIGWHPYFKASDKSKMKLNIEAERFIDFTNGVTNSGKEGELKEEIELTNSLDHVLYPVKDNKWSIRNEADGYEVEAPMDKLHDVVVVYTGFEGCVCVEPWTGLPNSINTKNKLKWVKANDATICGFEMKINAL